MMPVLLNYLNFQKFLNRGSLSFKVKFGIYTTLLVTFISLVKYEDGEYRYILSPKNIKIGDNKIIEIIETKTSRILFKIYFEPYCISLLK